MAFYHATAISKSDPTSIFTWPKKLLLSGSPTYIVNFFVILSGFACATLFAVKKKWNEVISILPITLISASATINFRYILALYPIYLGYALVTRKSRFLVGSSLGLTLLLEIFAISGWINGAPWLI